MLNYLKSKQNKFVSPTEVGRSYGEYKGKVYHSSIASPTLLKLTKEGIIKRNVYGHYCYIEKTKN